MARLDPASYVLGRREMPGLVLLARERYHGKLETRAAIVTHPESGITNLAGLKGGSFAFGERDSALGWHLPRAALVEAGLKAKDIVFTNAAFSRVLTAVWRKEVQAGVVRPNDLEKLAEDGIRLRVLANLRCPSVVWVTTSRLETNTVAALRDAILSLSDPMSLAPIERSLTGFSPAHSSDFDELEQLIDTSKTFDSP